MALVTNLVRVVVIVTVALTVSHNLQKPATFSAS